MKGGGAPRVVRVLALKHPWGLHVTRQARRLARRLAFHNAERPPLGAHTVAILGSGPALPSPAFAPDRLQRAPRARVVVPGWRGPGLPGRRLRIADAGRHASLRLQDVSGRRPSMSEARTYVEQSQFVVKSKIQHAWRGLYVVIAGSYCRYALAGH